jgi:g-D-glutamyl-meso-diaminopimelate peptidase
MIDLISKAEPFDYAALSDITQRLKNDYPFLHYLNTGKSTLNKSIHTLIWGQGDNNVVYVSGINASDFPISMCLMQFMADICENYRMRTPFCGLSVRKLFNTARICIIPMLNPDGIEFRLHGAQPPDEVVAGGPNVDFSRWVANARGVDIRKNFSVDFEARKESGFAVGVSSPEAYGIHAESEPETQAVCNFCRHAPVKKAFDFQGFDEKIYWDYGLRTSRKAFVKAQKLSELSGFNLAEEGDSETKGGFIDWFVNVFSKPAFTIGLGEPQTLMDKERFKKIEEFMLQAIIV